MIVTLKLPDNLHELAEKVATASKVSQEAVLLEWLEHPMQQPSKETFETNLAGVDSFSNIQLWTLVYRKISSEDEATYQEIYEKHEGGKSLTQDEDAHWKYLADLGLMLGTMRLKALLVLKERGEDVAQLLPKA